MAKRAGAAEPVEGPWALPVGWRWEQIGDVVSYLSRGRSPSYVDAGGTRIINQKCVRWAGLEGKWSKRTAQASADKLSPDQFIREADVLWNSTGTGTIGRACLINKRDLDEPTVVDTHVTILRPTSVVPRWLHYWLEVPFVQNAVAGIGSTNQVELARSTALAMPIPFPDANVQRSIVARIDELFAEIDDGEAALRRARDDLATWRKALLKAAVTGELTADWRAANPPTETGADLLARILADHRARWESDRKNKGKRYVPPIAPAPFLASTPDGWAVASMPQLGDFGRGKSKHRPRNDPRLYGGPYPFVQTGVVSASRGKIGRYEQTYTELGLAQSKLWPPETLCITIAANIAKTGVLQFDACFPDSVVGLSCAAGVAPGYVELVIRTLQQVLENDAPATAQKNINLETLETLPIPFPPSPEQAAIVAAFEDAEAAGDLLMRDDIDLAAAILRQSILAAAFRGELA